MSAERFRLDLDGVELADGKGRVVCILRWRTAKGLILRLPESTDVEVPWRLLTSAELDLAAGTVRVRFAAGARAELPWLPPSSELSGEWTDRHVLDARPS